MKLAILTPFSSHVLAPWIPELAESEAPKGMGAPAVWDIVTAQLKRGYDLHLITQEPNLSQPKSYRAKGVTIHFVPRRLRGTTKTLWSLERKGMVEVLKALKPDVIHAHWAYEYAWAALSYNPKISLITAHDIPLDILRYSANPYYLPQFFLSHWLFRNAHWLSADAPIVADYVRNFARKTAHIEIIPCSALTEPSETGLPQSDLKPPFILTLGLWNKVKNVATALQGFQRFRQRGFEGYHYAVFGAGLELDGPGHRWAQSQKLADQVQFLGKCSHEEALRVMARASLYLHPSRSETNSMAILEAMTSGIPVVAGQKSGGVPWVLADGKAGCLVDINDPEAIAEGLVKVLSNSSYQKEIVNNAKDLIQQRFALEVVVAAFERVYQKILMKVTQA